MTTKLAVAREYSASRLNHIVNHPSVRPWVAPGEDTLDLTAAVADQRNYLLMGDGGGFLLIWQEPGVYEVHSQFLPEARGANVLATAADASRYMFTRTDCTEIRTRVPHGNVGAAVLAKRMGWEFRFERSNAWLTSGGILVGVRYFAKTLEQWVSTADALEASGHMFHVKLEAAKLATGAKWPVHDDDLAHDRYVGAAVEMIACGQVAKGIEFYNSWARFAGYGFIAVIAADPVVIDIGDAILAVRGDDFDVLLCR